MTAEIIRRGQIRAITDLPPSTDGTTGHIEVEQAGQFYKLATGLAGGGDPALLPLGTEVSAYSSEFITDPGWTWLNQGTSTVTFALSRAIIVPEPGGAGVNNLRIYGFAPPAAPWGIRTRFLNWCDIAGQGGGFAARRSASALIYVPQSYVRASVSAGDFFTETWAVNEYSAYNLINSTLFGAANNDQRSRDRYFQMRCDGTSLFFDVSVDNARFQNVNTRAVATYLGGVPDFVGIVGNDPTAGSPGALVGYDWVRLVANANLNQ